METLNCYINCHGHRQGNWVRRHLPRTNLPNDPGALLEATKIMMDVVRNEETRFSNLNTRAIALVSATSLVTALAAVFSKDLLAATITGWGRTVGVAGMVLTIALLVLTATMAIARVLVPSSRLIFGDNSITDALDTLTSAAAVDKVAFTDYLQIYRSLSARNLAKAIWLNRSYWALLGSILSISLSTILVLLSRY